MLGLSVRRARISNHVLADFPAWGCRQLECDQISTFGFSKMVKQLERNHSLIQTDARVGDIYIFDFAVDLSASEQECCPALYNCPAESDVI